MKLSIITINYNNVEGLQNTIDSVLSQTFTDYEWIVIDGGSNDGSRELIEKNSKHFTYWCSEQDKGVYNAMNKGIAIARGEYVNFLNSGDRYCNSDILKEVFSEDRNGDILYGDVRYLYSDKIIEEKAAYPLTLEHLCKSTIFHQSSFIRVSLLQESGYNEKLKIVSDWEKWVLWVLQNKKYVYIPFVIAEMDPYGISHTNIAQRKAEREQVIERLISPCITRTHKIIEEQKEIYNYNPELGLVYNYINKRRLYKRIVRLALQTIKLIEKLS